MTTLLQCLTGAAKFAALVVLVLTWLTINVGPIVLAVVVAWILAE